MVITHRNDVPEWSSEFRDLVESLRREHTPTRIALHRLGRRRPSHDRGMDGPRLASSLTRLVARHTEGNPLFVVEMLKHLDETGALALRSEWHGPVTLADVGLPDGIRQLIGRRLERLGLTTRRLPRSCGHGPRVQLSDIEALVDVGEDAVLDAMDEALGGQHRDREAGAPGSFIHAHADPGGALYPSRPPVACGFTIGSQAHSSSWYRPSSRALPNWLTTLDRQPYTRAPTRLWNTPREPVIAAMALAFEHAAHWYDVALRAMDFVTPNADAPAKRANCPSNAGAASSRWESGRREKRLRSGSEPARSRRAASVNSSVWRKPPSGWMFQRSTFAGEAQCSPTVPVAMISGDAQAWRAAEWFQMATSWQQSDGPRGDRTCRWHSFLWPCPLTVDALLGGWPKKSSAVCRR